ncbi:Tyrosine-protein kinase HTK16 [Orchesella cincta]|uniref:Tyrosine-protein kinase n=1 Tax=Orchesella cincta TaxID=48709 RepID=A0A1D2MX86_ORCCI|nr:Tyrosine-protein kinase HTK16 [Orchesella cincta]
MSMSSLAGIPDDDAWFHDKITREDAEALLREVGEERAFLVRESTSCAGDYAISVYSDDAVHHIQVKRHEGDAFFSVEGREPCHGLDELIKSLQSPTSPDEDIVLQKPVIKSLPPPDVRRHGRTNLLHRATINNNVEIVSEMLRCKMRSIDAKNEDGQTATHIAAINNLPEILHHLIRAGTNVNAKDSSSCTPLHYACRKNFPNIVQILLEEGGANPQIRRNDNGWVPMHEAADQDHVECIRVLYMHNAPLRPRTDEKSTPLHLALRRNNQETVQFFDSVLPHEPMTSRGDWFHDKLGRQDALEFLRACRKASEIDIAASYYLIRRHSLKEDHYVLTLIDPEDKTYNFEIKREGNFLYIDNGPYLESLEHLVVHYSSWADGLPCRLQVPISPRQAKSAMALRRNLNSSRNCLDVPPPLPKRTPILSSPNSLSRICTDVENNNRSTTSFSNENIPNESLEIGELLGEGEYGEVYRGRLRTSLQEFLDVAIKTLKTEGEMSDWKKNEFLTEARTMLDLKHNHIVRIIGICWSPKTYMVQELCELGSLQDFLLDKADIIVPGKHFRKWANQIAQGMVYLQDRRFVHRDLAVRNILLSSVEVVKISDFGLSRALGLDSEYYTASQGGRWPIKWYAPESCTHGTFSHATDVWSYGITLWEIYSFGATPYGDMPGKEVIDEVEKGYRLEKPGHCSDPVYRVMRSCWSKNPVLRPTFRFLQNFFETTNDNDEVASPPRNQLNISPLPPPLPVTPEPTRDVNLNVDNTSEVSLMSFD